MESLHWRPGFGRLSSVGGVVGHYAPALVGDRHAPRDPRVIVRGSGFLRGPRCWAGGLLGGLGVKVRSMKENKTVIRSTPAELTPRPLIEVQPSFGAQPENDHVRGDYSDTLLDHYPFVGVSALAASSIITHARRDAVRQSIRRLGSLMGHYAVKILKPRRANATGPRRTCSTV